MSRRNLMLLISAGLIAIVPLFMSFQEGDAQFGGADGLAQAQIVAIAPGYRPWANPIWQPPSEEIASLLFALQAAFGAGLLGYCIGFVRGRASGEVRAGAEAGGDVHR